MPPPINFLPLPGSQPIPNSDYYQDCRGPVPPCTGETKNIKDTQAAISKLIKSLKRIAQERIDSDTEAECSCDLIKITREFLNDEEGFKSGLIIINTKNDPPTACIMISLPAEMHGLKPGDRNPHAQYAPKIFAAAKLNRINSLADSPDELMREIETQAQILTYHGVFTDFCGKRLGDFDPRVPDQFEIDMEFEELYTTPHNFSVDKTKFNAHGRLVCNLVYGGGGE